MQLRRLSLALVVLTLGCPQPLGDRCGPDLPPCPAGTSCADSVCKVQSTGGGQAGGVTAAGGIAAGGSPSAGGLAGGSAGGNQGGSGGGSTDAGACPVCADHEECVGAACLPRYSSIGVVAAARTNQPTPVFAMLVTIGGRTGNPPASLVLVATLSGGPPLRVEEAMSPLADGGFALAGTLPVPHEGVWSIAVAWPDGGPTGTGQTIVDLSGPNVTVSVPAPTARGLFAGGLDFRDPLDTTGGPPSWRRHEVLPLKVESSSADLMASSVQLSVAGSPWTGPLLGCGPDGGVTDAGYCRIAQVSLGAVPLLGLRDVVSFEVSARDDLGNVSSADAGAVLTRWAFSFDGGSAQNGFALGSNTLVVPNTATSSVHVVSAGGAPRGTVTTNYPPVRDVAVGQLVPERFYTLELLPGSGDSSGEAYEVGQLANHARWAPDAVRTSLERSGPMLATSGGRETVAAVFRSSGVTAVWASFSAAMLEQNSTSAAGPTATATPLKAVALGPQVIATDGASLFNFAGSALFQGLAPDSTTQTPPAPFTSIGEVLGRRNGKLVGWGSGGGAQRVFEANVPSGFNQWPAMAGEPLTAPVFGAGALYFLKLSGTFSTTCRTTSAMGSYTCATTNPQELGSALALGAGDTLYVAIKKQPGNQLVIQVRTASTLALRDEIPVPGAAPGGCTSLTPTCIAGDPVIGCVDTVGRIAFVFTDARGIDTTADWPMEGHDPGKTFNTATDLTPYGCP